MAVAAPPPPRRALQRAEISRTQAPHRTLIDRAPNDGAPRFPEVTVGKRRPRECKSGMQTLRPVFDPGRSFARLTFCLVFLGRSGAIPCFLAHPPFPNRRLTLMRVKAPAATGM